MAVLGKSRNGEHSAALENFLPLLGGEGWGEGERELQLNRVGFRLTLTGPESFAQFQQQFLRIHRDRSARQFRLDVWD